ncbi:unnamed protein product [Phaedon cochleariae]|uniref:valine--tRNA ligase n=1 Tax=Phaedon cochleariae TaxID=80249 RepID=A0A9P0DS76_PHACE|nr:unnamed protein product [Phaedon cochleariae]
MFRLYCKCSVYKNQISAVRFVVRRGKCSKISKLRVSELDSGYVPHKVEEEFGIADDYFKPPLQHAKPFTIVLPPPNITGTLHLGHALTATIEDVLTRWNRMQGIQTVWVPGFDHAGIATQVVVEKRLLKECQKTRHDLGREQFQRKVWEWKEQNAHIIGDQLRRLGVSLNWEREMFTMDEKRSIAVQEAFIKLFESGLIYRADHLVNWSCVLQSAISDIEVEHLSLDGPTHISVPGYEDSIEFGILTKFAYKIEDSDEELVVATTRPETMLGDVAVAVHPEDDRYSRYVGRHLWHPFRKEKIPVIRDDFVSKEFGTGAVKITPAHDHADFEAAKRHSLPSLQVIDETGRLNTECGQFKGLRRFEARKVIVEELSRLQLFRGTEDHAMIVPICSRSKDVVELLARPQWFVKCADMAARSVDEVKNGNLKITPKIFEKTWFDWLENIRDWCISRQLWWGHRIPAYLCYPSSDASSPTWIAAMSEDEAKKKASAKFGVDAEAIVAKRDEDVLDTWFSSALQPFAAFGWPEETKDLSKFYPLSLMETGHDILFFWVARMVMLGTQLTGKLPFNEILLHGIVCDAHGRKMSKSLGNVIAPEDVIRGVTLQEMENTSKASHSSGILSEEELKKSIRGQQKMFPQGIPECGSDALRFTLMSHNIKSHYINFDVNECYTNKLFCNKIWQATRFTNSWFTTISDAQDIKKAKFDDLLSMDRWILSRLSLMVSNTQQGLQNYDFHKCTTALKTFLYYDFCDIYLETTKRGLRLSNSPAASGHCWTLLTCLDVGLRTLAPFMPLLSRHLHQRLPLLIGEERLLDFPKDLNWRDESLEQDINDMMDVVIAIRRLKKILNVTAKHEPKVRIFTSLPSLGSYSETIMDLSACHEVNILGENLNMVSSDEIKDTVGRTTICLAVPEDIKRAIEIDFPKMEIKKEKLFRQLEKLRKMTCGSTYKMNASSEAQEVHSKKIAKIEEQISRIENIQKLSSS